MIKKISIILIIAFILTTMVFPAMHAARAVALVDDAVIAVIVLALAAMGITFQMTGGYVTVRDWIADMVEQSGIPFAGVKYGVNSAGDLLLNNAFLRRVAALAEYIKYEFGLTDNTQTQIIESGYELGEIQLYRFPVTFTLNNGRTYRVTLVSSSTLDPVYMFFTYNTLSNGKHRLSWYMLSQSEGTVTYIVESYGYGGGDRTYNIQTQRLGNTDITPWWIGAQVTPPGTDYESLSAAGVTAYTRAQVEDALGNTDVGHNDSLVANVGTLEIPDAATIGTNGGILTLPLPWGVTLPQIVDDVPGLVLTDELDGNVELTLEEEDDVISSVDQSATAAEVVSSDPDEYSVSGLTQVFPFCVPFDLYNFLECLDAEPEAPAFTWRIYVPDVVDEEVDVDLSEFETLAQIIRIMELLLFCVGLAFVTRKLIRG